jgi:hypothetical protein
MVAKHYLTVLLIFLNVSQMLSIKLNGRILNATTNEPLSYVSVMLLKTDSAFLAGTTTNEKGEFVLS